MFIIKFKSKEMSCNNFQYHSRVFMSSSMIFIRVKLIFNTQFSFNLNIVEPDPYLPLGREMISLITPFNKYYCFHVCTVFI